MPRLSATSNPTSLQEIARKDVSLSRTNLNGKPAFQIDVLTLTNYVLDPASPVAVIARAGNTSRRFNLGTVGSLIKNPFSLDELDFSRPVSFRLLVKDKSSARLVASAERLRCAGDGDVESVLPIRCVDLGQRIWRLTFSEDGPELLCNERVFPNGPSAEANVPFCSLVLPEALRQVLEYIAKDPGKLEDEDSVWIEWKMWMLRLGIEVPPSDEDSRRDWVEESAGRFCEVYKSTDALISHLGQGDRE